MLYNVNCNTLRKTEFQFCVVILLQIPSVFRFSSSVIGSKYSCKMVQPVTVKFRGFSKTNRQISRAYRHCKVFNASFDWFNSLVQCVFVFQVRLIGNAFYDWRNSSADLLVCSFLMLNFIADPFMYVLTRKQYRQVLKMIFTCRCKGRLDDRVFPLNAQRWDTIK